MTERKRETPEERNGKRLKKRRERVREGESNRGRIVRHEVGQSNVPPTCENLFMHEKAGKASERERESERDEGMGGNVAKRHSGEHKNKERPQERASKRANEREREREG